MKKIRIIIILAILSTILTLIYCSGSTKSIIGLPVGSQCKSSSDCADKLVCIYTTEKDSVNLFPNGYCSRYCLNDKDCPENSKCIGDICIADCSKCDREGYICKDGKYCVPDLNIGGSCGSDSDCQTGKCFMLGDKFKNGYCSLTCDSGSKCPISSGGLCTNFEGKADGESICALGCSKDSDCRIKEKYACRLVKADSAEIGNIYTTVCSGVDNLGATCEKDADCSSGLSCISQSDLGKGKGGDFSERICSKQCTKDSDCPHIFQCAEGDESCLKTARCVNGYCFRGCEQDKHCAKSKYACRGYKYDNNKDDYRYFCNSVASIGAECSKDEDCTSGLFCLLNKSNYSGGFCTKSCTKDDDCPTEMGLTKICYEGICQRSCNSDADCGRKGYLCMEQNGKGICQSKTNYGAACKSDDDCAEGLSCYKGYAFPDGYCTRKGETEGDCTGGGVPGNLNLCMRQCDTDKDCKRDGYFCFDSGSAKYCSTGFNVGYPCSKNPAENTIDCGEGLRCESGSDYEFGYCTMDCEKADDLCPNGSKCVTSKKMCMRVCSMDNQCLISDYTCRETDKIYVCVGGKNIGAECSSDEDCSSGLSCDKNQINGYCTTSCKDSDCPADSVCIGEVCKRTCKLDKDCGRSKYFCLTSRSVSYCVSSKNFGAACDTDDDCVSPLVCYKPDRDKTGLCSNSASQLCSSDTDCGESYAICNKDGDRHCYRKCNSDSECGREDMKCKDSMCIYK
ncbi:MAG: hypothetical protein ACP5KG_12270 [Myxococcota bacterium]